MQRIISLTVITASALLLSGCMAISNKALTISAKPTTYDGYWTGSGGGHQINWFIRPDGTGILCEVTTYSVHTVCQTPSTSFSSICLISPVVYEVVPDISKPVTYVGLL